MTLISDPVSATRVEPFPVLSRFLIGGWMPRPEQLYISTAHGTHTALVEQVPGLTKLRMAELAPAEVVPALSSAIEFLSAQARNVGVIEVGNVSAADFSFGNVEDDRLTVDPRAFWQWPAPWIARSHIQIRKFIS